MKDKVIVYILSRARAGLVSSAIPKWERVGVPADNIVIVLDPEEKQHNEYHQLKRTFRCHILTLDDHNQGLGYIRDMALEHHLDNLQSDVHIQADDDYFPTAGDANAFGRVVLENELIGCGASYSYHGLTLGNETIKLENVDFPNPSPGLGGNVFAINSEIADEVGGFPWWATCLGEDHEMIRQSIRYGLPWYYSTRLRISGLARYSDGGHSDLYRSPKHREREEQRVHQKIHDRWPEYVSKPPAKYRSSWKKMMGDYINEEFLELPREVERAYRAHKAR